MSGLRIAMIASSRFPVREPFAGGLEAQTHALASELMRRGHQVTVFAAPGSDPKLNSRALDVAEFRMSEHARDDVAAPAELWMSEHHAYLGLMLELSRSGRRNFDIIHNNSLHHLPVAMSSAVDIPLVTTLHTPPTPWLESAIDYAAPSAHFVAVSSATAQLWHGTVQPGVIRNGIDVQRWSLGPGGESAVWSGRIVPEKAPHRALDAARLAQVPITLAGPIYDRAYFTAEIEPRLGEGARYAGHLETDELARLVGRSCVAVVTPEWEEPYGLVAAEAMACGTPVASFARGGLREIVDPTAGVLCAPDDVQALADAIRRARLLPRDGVRRYAVEHLSLRRMVDDYEDLFSALTYRRQAA